MVRWRFNIPSLHTSIQYKQPLSSTFLRHHRRKFSPLPFKSTDSNSPVYLSSNVNLLFRSGKRETLLPSLNHKNI
ncbi:hypothetical protein Nepgr_027909 [Nepenthes gracilis]|uniref:Uncharacterized protein n=1 Tax=Nepenthes gracilis TaxID=150966 RepID=A0AAD3TBD5_NEPGR|nr:hypothetical protein Nepgr_027909 [Nepenthes gracilis]